MALLGKLRSTRKTVRDRHSPKHGRTRSTLAHAKAIPSAGTPPVMVVLGDSLLWGQGLLEENKTYSFVYSALKHRFPLLQLDLRAHSGAAIGVNLKPPWPRLPGEVPALGPSILYQCTSYSGDPSLVKIVLLSGGINDVDFRFILNPTTTPSALCRRIKQHCFDDMKILLHEVISKFSDPHCRIVLVGYYPILAPSSDSAAVPFLLKARGIPDADHLMRSAVSDPRDLAVQFWKESGHWLKQAAAEVNAKTGNRIAYVVSPFQEENALFARNSWLWSVGIDLAAEDQVVDSRTDDCIRLVKGWLECQVCRRASVGHPSFWTPRDQEEK
jgi:hypothetical protein